MHKCTCTYTDAPRIHIHTYTHMCIHTYTSACLHMHTREGTRTWTHPCTHTHVHPQTDRCTHGHTVKLMKQRGSRQDLGGSNSVEAQSKTKIQACEGLKVTKLKPKHSRPQTANWARSDKQPIISLLRFCFFSIKVYLMPVRGSTPNHFWLGTA